MIETLETLIVPFYYFNANNERVYWLFLMSALTISIIVFVFSKSNKSNLSLFKYLIPVKVLCHRSAINDYLFFYVNVLFQGTFIVIYFSSLSLIVSGSVLTWLNDLDPFFQADLMDVSIFNSIFLTVFFAVIADLAIYTGHYLQHKIPWLWEFHKDHHSAEVLMPITVYRMHPVDNI